MEHQCWIKRSLVSASVAASIGLTACSGGDGSSGSSLLSESTPNTGVFLDSKVEGLGYSTDTLNGTTNADGEFQYNDGETVTFSLHGQEISKALGHSVLTPFDNQDNTVNEDYAINVLSMLQTLDSDGDPTNGIKLDPITGTMNVNFDQGIDTFATDTAVTDFVAANANSTLVPAADAIEHFATTLSNISNSYTLDITGKSAVGVITADYCESGFQVGFDYTFGVNDYTFTGTDTINSENFMNCTAGTTGTWTDSYNSFPDFGLDCGPVCTYTELNRVSTGVDGDGRDFITTVWHSPNSNIVTYTKRITNDPSNPGVTWTGKEVITLRTNTIVGSWYIDSGNKTLVTFIDDTNYFVTQVIGVGEPLCSDGMESGTYTWDSATGSISFVNVIDTTGDCGLTSTQGETYSSTFTINGNTLTSTDIEGTFQLSRVTDANNPIIGGWYIDESNTGGNKTIVTFIDNSNYLVTQVVGAGELTAVPPSFHGMEYGTYTYDTNTGNIIFTNVIDTTGDSGFTSTQGATWGDVGDEATIEVANDQLIFTFVAEGGGSFTLDAVK